MLPGRASSMSEDALGHRLLRTLSAAKGRYGGKEEDMTFLMNMVEGNDFQALMGVQQTLASNKQRSAALSRDDAASREPVTQSSGALLTEVCDTIFHSGVRRNSHEAKLLTILSSPHFHGLMSAHDRVAKGEFASSADWRALVTSTESEASNSNAEEQEVDGGQQLARTVRLQKNGSQPFGATIKIRQSDKAVVIGRVIHGSVAYQSGMLIADDELLAVNGQSVVGMTMEEALELLKTSWRHLDLKLKSKEGEGSAVHAASECHITVRAQFNYDPRQDRLNPCPNASMAFDRGELLTVVSQADPKWWQARRVDSSGNVLAGLIPGPLERERREVARKKREEPSKQGGTFRKLSLGGTKKRTRGYTVEGRDDPDAMVEFASYEEVARMLPKQREPRPIVLIGAAGVGCTEVRDRLVGNHRHVYACARPTSTMMRRNSSSSQYEHVSVGQMLDSIASNRFVEYSQVGNHWFGTSLASIQRVQRAGRTCVLHVPPKTLRTLRIADIKPFVIFLAAPSLERLRANLRYRDSQSIARTHHLEEELSAMVTASARIEALYGHYFDLRLVQNETDVTVRSIDLAMEKVRTEENWVPAEWLRNVGHTDSLIE